MSEAKKRMELVYSGKKFRAYLKSKGLSYADAAERFGVNKNTISKVVSDRQDGTASLDTLFKIINGSDLVITDFFKYREIPETGSSEGKPPVSYNVGMDGLPIMINEPEGTYKNPKKEVIRLNNLINEKMAELLELKKLKAKAEEEYLTRENNTPSFS